MPASSLSALRLVRPGRRWPELLLALLAGLIFLGSLGSVEMWGKREQRASLEAIDTIDNHHWLVAQIQGHPRLEKPPLSRWAIASLMALTGRRDEWVVRLPAAVSAIAMVALVYALGRRLAGRSVGLASAFFLCSTPFFVAEMRQAGNDGLLALFTTVALHAAWIRLDSGTSAWTRVMYCALGLGVLAKGPVILMIVGLTLIPYLAIAGKLETGLKMLLDGWGLVLFLVLSLSWPVLVILNDPHALGVWGLEMGQKTGLSQLTEHRKHSFLAKDWPGMILPWPMIGLLALALPFLRRPDRAHAAAESRRASEFWFPWSWAMANLAAFCLWKVAKPSYYLPCMPGMAILLGGAWIRITRDARLAERAGAFARSVLQLQWVLLFAGATAAPAIARGFIAPSVWPWTIALASASACAVILSAFLWRRGVDALSLAPLTAAGAITVLIGYGIIAPSENAERGHRELASTLDRVVPPGGTRVLFLQEIDEGLSFYLRDHRLEPLPGSQRRYNAAYDYVDDYLNRRRQQLTRKEVEARVPEALKRALLEWIDRGETRSDYILVPTGFYDRFIADLAPRAVPVLREENKKRNELTLLRIGRPDASPVASMPEDPATTRR